MLIPFHQSRIVKMILFLTFLNIFKRNMGKFKCKYMYNSCNWAFFNAFGRKTRCTGFNRSDLNRHRHRVYNARLKYGKCNMKYLN